MKRALATAAISLLAFSCEAAEWVLDPSVDTRANVTDNLNLTPGVQESTWWLSLSPAVSFSRNTETSQVAGSARLSAHRYPDAPTLDTQDQSFYVSSKLATERHAWGLIANYNRDSTLQSELGTTGIPQVRKQRAFTGISPSWRYSLTERSSVFVRYNYDQARYEADAGLTDYSNQQLATGIEYLWNERIALTLTGIHSRFETDTGSQTTSTSSLNGGITYTAGERLSLALSAGVRHSNIQVNSAFLACPIGSIFQCQILGIPLVLINANTQVSDDGWLLDGNADYSWERTSAGMLIGRDVNPTGSGLLVQTDRIGGSLNHEFSEKLSGGLVVSVLQSRYLGSTDGNRDNYFSLNGSLTWNLAERWRLTTGYSHAYQKSKNVPEDASANTAYVTIGYHWPRMSLSR